MAKRTPSNTAIAKKRRAPMKHGLYGLKVHGTLPCMGPQDCFLVTGCTKVKEGYEGDCPVIRRFKSLKVRELLRLPWIEEFCDLDEVSDYVDELVECGILKLYRAQKGFLNNGEVKQGLENLLGAAHNRLIRRRTVLGLNPAGRKALNVDGGEGLDLGKYLKGAYGDAKDTA